jgi:hypothetical protein
MAATAESEELQALTHVNTYLVSRPLALTERSLSFGVEPGPCRESREER